MVGIDDVLREISLLKSQARSGDPTVNNGALDELVRKRPGHLHAIRQRISELETEEAKLAEKPEPTQSDIARLKAIDKEVHKLLHALNTL